MGFGAAKPIESIDGKPIFGFVIDPNRLDELIAEIKQEFGNDFILATKLHKDKLRVTFVLTAKQPGSNAQIAQKLDRISDGMNIKRIAVADMEPTEVNFSFGKKTN